MEVRDYDTITFYLSQNRMQCQQQQSFLSLKLAVRQWLAQIPGCKQAQVLTAKRNSGNITHHTDITWVLCSRAWIRHSTPVLVMQLSVNLLQEIRGWREGLSTTVQWMLKCQSSAISHQPFGWYNCCMHCQYLYNLSHLPKLFQWRTVLDNVGEGTCSCTPHTIAYQAAVKIWIIFRSSTMHMQKVYCY